MAVSVRRLLAVAALTRGAYLLAVFVLSAQLPSYDTSSALLSDVCADDWPQRQAAAGRGRPLVVWDAVYFHRVAHCGYEFEQFHAFFPFLPGEAVALQCNKLLLHDTLLNTIGQVNEVLPLNA